MTSALREARAAMAAVAALAVLLCGVYPGTVMLVNQILFPGRSNGSLTVRAGRTLGSTLIGRDFAGPGYFHPRPSAAGVGYDPTASGGSNLGPLSRTLIDSVRARAERYRTENGLPAGTAVPADAVTASASGLDPHISPENARLQAPRVAKARGWAVDKVLRRIAGRTEGRDLGFLGEPRVNVLLLNFALDEDSRGGR